MNEAAYEAFFDELGQIEKRAMMSQAAMAKEANIFGSIGKGFKMMATSAPSKTVGRLQKAWQGGIKAQAKRVGALKPIQGPVPAGGAPLGNAPDLTSWQKFTGGMRGVARSKTGKALGVGLAGAGVIGGGAYLGGRQAGRSSAAPGY